MRAAPFQEFFRTEAAGGAILVACAAAALVIANSAWVDAYHYVLEATIIRSAGPRYRSGQDAHNTRFTGGAAHLPLVASSLGQYNRMAIQNGPFGAGSQLASLSLPGDWFWM